jgi:hypothetical protein
MVLAAWMLDPIACAGMVIGAPHVSVSALADLHHLLIDGGFRRSSLDGSNIVQEKQDEAPADTNAAIDIPTPAQHGVRRHKPSGHEPIGTRHGPCTVEQPVDGSSGRRGGGA